MIEYYSKLEAVLTSGLESIRRKSDTLMGIEVYEVNKCQRLSLQNCLAEEWLIVVETYSEPLSIYSSMMLVAGAWFVARFRSWTRPKTATMADIW